jgi:hypothetical protein
MPGVCHDLKRKETLAKVNGDLLEGQLILLFKDDAQNPKSLEIKSASCL